MMVLFTEQVKMMKANSEYWIWKVNRWEALENSLTSKMWIKLFAVHILTMQEKEMIFMLGVLDQVMFWEMDKKIVLKMQDW